MPEIERDTVIRINKGDTKAFEVLYSTCYVYLCAVATKYIFSAEIAREIVNDVFLNVWNNRSTLVSPVLPYLIRAVKNRCLNHLRQQRLQMIPLSEVEEGLFTIQEQHIHLEAHPLAFLENKEFEEKISSAIDCLPEKCKDIFVQYVYQSKSYDEIARTNNISPSTVRVQIKIGLTKLRGLLGDWYPLFLLLFNFHQK